MADVEMRLTPGRPKDLAVRAEILAAVGDLRAANIETIRRRVSERLGRNVSWPTIRNHLEDLDAGRELTTHVFERYRTRRVVLVTPKDVSFG
jgi:hypothetical protein